MRIIYKNRRGQLMDLFLVFTTVIMCGIVILLYLQSQSNLSVAIVSPVSVLELDDDRILFERGEYELLLDVYCDDVDDAKGEFCSKFDDLNNVGFLKEKNFPLTDKVVSGNLCDNIYSFLKNGEDMKVVREGIGKKIDLKADSGPKKVRFNVLLEFDLAKEYLLTRGDC